MWPCRRLLSPYLLFLLVRGAVAPPPAHVPGQLQVRDDVCLTSHSPCGDPHNEEEKYTAREHLPQNFRVRKRITGLTAIITVKHSEIAYQWDNYEHWAEACLAFFDIAQASTTTPTWNTTSSRDPTRVLRLTIGLLQVPGVGQVDCGLHNASGVVGVMARGAYSEVFVAFARAATRGLHHRDEHRAYRYEHRPAVLFCEGLTPGRGGNQTSVVCIDQTRPRR